MNGVLKIMLDTNILVDFLLIEWKIKGKQPIHKALKKSEIIYRALLNKKIENFVTQWNLLEYRDAVAKLVTERKLIENGYSLQEFNEGRKLLPITSKEMLVINKAIEDIKNISIYHKGDMPENGLKLIEKICKKGISLLDAIHLLYSYVIKDCEYFVTRDNILYNIFRDKLKNVFIKKVQVLNRKEFIAILKKNKII